MESWFANGELNLERLNSALLASEMALALSGSDKEFMRKMFDAHIELLKLWPGNQNGVLDTLVTSTKSDGTIVTIADVASEGIIVGAIRELHPGAAIVTEEDSITHCVTAKDMWIVDPLDGTRDYQRGGADFAILVSQVVNGKSVFSVIDYPAQAETVIAKQDAAWSLDSGSALPIIKKDIEREPIYLYGVYCDLPKVKFREAPSVHCVSSGLESTRALLEIAKGTIDGAIIQMCGHKVWDIIALEHTVQASGGYISDELGEPVSYLGTTVLCRYIVAARSDEIHRRLLEWVSSME